MKLFLFLWPRLLKAYNIVLVLHLYDCLRFAFSIHWKRIPDLKVACFNSYNSLQALKVKKAITKCICQYCYVKMNRLLLLFGTRQKLQICSIAGSPSARQSVLSRGKTWPVELREVILEVCSCRLYTRKKSCRGLEDSSKVLIPFKSHHAWWGLCMKAVIVCEGWGDATVVPFLLYLHEHFCAQTLAFVSSVCT